MPAILDQHPGLKHRSVQNADGTWNILDVPILGPVPKGARMNAEDIGEEWMRAAVRVAEADLRSGHLGSISVGHHPDVDIGIKPAYGGKVLPRRVGRTTMEDREVPCLFADFLFVPADVKDRIKAHELSYRSPEVVNWAKFRVDNVSLLSTEPPFFRVGMIDIGEEVPYVGSAGAFASTDQFATAHFSDQPLASYRFAEGVTMPKNAKMADPPPPASPPDPKPIPEPQPEAKAEEKPPEAKKPKGLSVDALKAAMVALSALIDQLEEAPAPEPEPEPDPELQMQEEAMPTDQPPKGAGKPEPIQMKDVEVAAKLSAIESRVRHMEAAKRLESMVAKGIEDLEAEGIQLDDQDRESVAKFAAMGEEAHNAHIALMKRHAVRDSATSFGALVGKLGQRDPPEVAKFAASPAELAKARDLSASYDRLESRGYASQSREEFIRMGMTELKQLVRR